MEIIKVLSVSVLLTQTVSSENPSLLLKSQISDAKCLSQCVSIQSLPEQTQCYKKCKMNQEQHPMADLYVEDQVRFEYFYRESCQLTWSIRTQNNENVVFIIAGQDQGGMWHLVAGNMTSSKLDMAPSFGAKYPILAVIAVNSHVVLDTLMVNLPSFQECFEEEKPVMTTTVLGNDLIIVIILALVVLLLFIILLAIVCCKTAKPDETRINQSKNSERQQVYETNQKHNFEQFTKERYLNIASDNTYVDFHHLYEDVV